MRLLPCLLFFSIFGLSVKAQMAPDTTLIVYWNNTFTYKCMVEKSRNYGIAYLPAPISFYITDEFSPDSVLLHNQKVYNHFKERLGEGWLEKFEREVSDCEHNICNADSVTKYSNEGVGLALTMYMQPGTDSLNETHLCLLNNSTFAYLNYWSTLEIAIGSHAIPGEDSLSLILGQKVKDHLVSKGIEPGRITLTDYGTQHPRLRANPDHWWNRRIVITVIKY